MVAFSCWPLGEPDATSALSRSPEERWVKPYLATIRSHWVPFPEPGPPATHEEIIIACWIEHTCGKLPKIQMMGTPDSLKGVVSICFLSIWAACNPNYFLVNYTNTWHTFLLLKLFINLQDITKEIEARRVFVNGIKYNPQINPNWQTQIILWLFDIHKI